MNNFNDQKANLMRKINELRNASGSQGQVSRPTPINPPNNTAKQNPNINNGSRGCGACSRKKNT